MSIDHPSSILDNSHVLGKVGFMLPRGHETIATDTSYCSVFGSLSSAVMFSFVMFVIDVV